MCLMFAVIGEDIPHMNAVLEIVQAEYTNSIRILENALLIKTDRWIEDVASLFYETAERISGTKYSDLKLALIEVDQEKSILPRPQEVDRIAFDYLLGKANS